MKFWLVVFFFMPFLLCPAGAVVTADDEAKTLGAVVVTGAQSGPKIWKFQRGRKIIWVLGTLQPLSKGATFNTEEIRARLAKSDVVLDREGLVIGDNIGIFRGLTLWPAIRRSKFNPSGRPLRDLLPPTTYDRWLQAKAKYIGRNNGVDRLRPMYAAYELFEAAVRKAGLVTANPAYAMINKEAKKLDIPIIDTKMRLSINNPRDAVTEFAVPQADDIRCLEQTLDRLDRFAQNAATLGDAWSEGDVARLNHTSNAAISACWARLTNEAIGKQQGISDLYHLVETRWIDALNRALREHDVVFTTMPVRDLLDSTGLAAALNREGFRTPQSSGDEDAPSLH